MPKSFAAECFGRGNRSGAYIWWLGTLLFGLMVHTNPIESREFKFPSDNSETRQKDIPGTGEEPEILRAIVIKKHCGHISVTRGTTSHPSNGQMVCILFKLPPSGRVDIHKIYRRCEARNRAVGDLDWKFCKDSNTDGYRECDIGWSRCDGSTIYQDTVNDVIVTKWNVLNWHDRYARDFRMFVEVIYTPLPLSGEEDEKR